MAELTENTPLPLEIGDYNELPIAADTRIFQGAMTSRSAAGYINSLQPGEVFTGHCTAEVDNRDGAAGDLRVQVYRGRYTLLVSIPGVTVTDAGKDVYATDNNTLTLARTGTRVGRVIRWDDTNVALVEFEPWNTDAALDDAEPLVVELDCETGVEDEAKAILYPANNGHGYVIVGVYGRITEVFGGASQDQGVVTVKDSDGNTIATLTPSDAGADAVGDIVIGYNLYAASTGAAMKTIAAGKGLTAEVTTPTSGSGAAGKMAVYVDVRPLG